MRVEPGSAHQLRAFFRVSLIPYKTVAFGFFQTKTAGGQKSHVPSKSVRIEDKLYLSLYPLRH